MQIASCCFQISSVPAVIMVVVVIKDGRDGSWTFILLPLGQVRTAAIHCSSHMETHSNAIVLFQKSPFFKIENFLVFSRGPNPPSFSLFSPPVFCGFP